MASLKYASLADPAPEFLPIKEAIDANFTAFFSLPLEQQHPIWAAQPHPLPDGTPTDLEVSSQQVPVRDGAQIGIRIYRNTTKLREMGKTEAPLVVVAHGGGWTLGNNDVEEGVCRWIAHETGAVVVDVDYRLAPEYKYPHAITDYYDAFKWCKDNSASLGIDPSLIITCGSSAGGGMAATLSIMARDNNESGIVGQLLNGPVLCHPKFFPKDEYEYTSWEQNKNASILTAHHMLRCWEAYYPDTGPDVYANPFLVKSTDGLPPTLLQITGMDIIRDECFAFADKLKENAVPVKVITYPGLPHGFYTLPHLESSTKYYKAAAAWAKELLATKGWAA